MIRLANIHDLEFLYHVQQEPGAKDAGFLWRNALADRINAGHVWMIDDDNAADEVIGGNFRNVHLVKVPRGGWHLAPRRSVLEITDAQGIGYMIVSPRRDGRLHIPQVVITEEQWRAGHGTSLIKHVLAQPWPDPIYSLTLKCAIDSPANRFWPTAGLQHVVNSPGQRRVLMNWSAPIGPNGQLEIAPPSRRPRRLYERETM